MSKIEAIATVALSNDFLDFKPSIIHDYLWSLNDLIANAKTLEEESLQSLLNKFKALYN